MGRGAPGGNKLGNVRTHTRLQPSAPLGGRRKRELVLCASRATQSQPVKSENTLQMREQHLHAFAIAPGLLESVGPGECASNVTSVFVDVTRDHACWSVRAALGLEGTLA